MSNSGIRLSFGLINGLNGKSLELEHCVTAIQLMGCLKQNAFQQQLVSHNFRV